MTMESVGHGARNRRQRQRRQCRKQGNRTQPKRRMRLSPHDPGQRHAVDESSESGKAVRSPKVSSRGYQWCHGVLIFLRGHCNLVS